MAIVNLNPNSAASEISKPDGAVPGTDGERPVTNWKSHLESELDKLAVLPKNWDSYGAPPIDPRVIAAARTLIRALPEKVASKPLVVPMSTGNLQLEWHRGKKVLELEFDGPTTIRYLRFDPHGKVEDEESIAIEDVTRVVELIQWYNAGILA